jgi:hypothetical protein
MERPKPDEYVGASGYDARSLDDLVEDFAAVREANLRILRAFDARAWERVGVANESPVSARALAFMMAGHVRHHVEILRSRHEVGPAGTRRAGAP